MVCFLIISKKVCQNYTPLCAIVHILECTKTHFGVLLNTPVFRVCLVSDSTETIRLLALDFYAVIVDSGFALINYHRIEIESE